MKTISKILLSCFALFCLTSFAQELKKTDIKLDYGESPHAGRIVVRSVTNNYDAPVCVDFINEYETGKLRKSSVSLGHKEKNKKIPGTVTCNLVQAYVPVYGAEKMIDIYYAPKPTDADKSDAKAENAKSDVIEPKQKADDAVVEKDGKPQAVSEKVVRQIPKKGAVDLSEIIPDFVNYLESIPFYSSAAIGEEASLIDSHINNLRNWKDRESYIKDQQLDSYISTQNDMYSRYEKSMTSLINDYMGKFENRKIINEKECVDSLQAIVKSRLELRRANISRLAEEMDSTPVEESTSWKDWDWKTIGLGAGLFLLLIILVAWFRKANRKARPLAGKQHAVNEVADASSAIVVRRKTASILKKQSLEDVIDNDDYMKIDCNEFCGDSAVRRMYLKNTCIKDIYNMYAEDLRNPDNPKEDGCMVLGRWVHDAEGDEYYVSLEYVVRPGDDAVFTEYELNFGGKIKMKVMEKLRKLRRETNMQYDLTCWVHSHPGLGVFFSNSDSNVQMQLKHPTHPKFLTAIVVDILTPQQELGIFTFKRDSSINSKADLKKMYSLEEMYKWAVESERNAFKAENFRNVLADAKSRKDDCYGIELSNGAIIDMAKLAEEPNAGVAAMVYGYTKLQGTKSEHIAVKVAKGDSMQDNELVGCFIMATHCSIPSIRKAIAGYVNKIKFVLVYNTTDGFVTSIPVFNSEICMDENYYGDQQLEDLKIWTRRKR